MYHPYAPLIEDYRAGDQICSECGLVVGDRVIDAGSEWRSISNEKGGEDKSRVGGAENSLPGSSNLSTMIGPGTGKGSFDSTGTAIYNNRRSVTSSDRTLIKAFRTISEMADRINLTKTIIDRANNLFKMIKDGKNLKGKANDAITAACLYIACRQEEVPRTFKEIVSVSTVSKKEIGRCFKLILNAHDTRWTSSRQETLCLASAGCFTSPGKYRRAPHKSPRKPPTWTSYLAARPSPWQLQQSTWRARPATTRGHSGRSRRSLEWRM